MKRPRKIIPETFARKILSDLSISRPEDIAIEHIAEYFSAHVQQVPLSKADGLMLRIGQKAIISVRKNIQETGKKRFVIAHELGHFFLHPNIKQYDLCTQGELDILSYQRSNEEREANYFAAELLMPKHIFIKEINKNIDPCFSEIVRLSKVFDTTLSATAIQYIKYCGEPCSFIITKDLKRPWSFRSECFEFWISNRDHVHQYSVTSNAVSVGLQTDRADDVPAGVWLDNFSDSGKDFITEEAFVFGNSGIVYTLLWLHDSI